MLKNLPLSVSVFTEQSGSHLQGIAIDKDRNYIYCSFTTCLLKFDLKGNMLASVNGLVGHLGCIAYNYSDGKVYGSLEFKNDAIGKGILNKIGYKDNVEDGFYIVNFDVSKMNRMNMNAEEDGIMEAVFLNEVFDDYSAEGHRYGCSGIDGITFAPDIGKNKNAEFLYVAYGVYGDVLRDDNDYQIILKYDISDWDNYALPLNQHNMHRSGPEKPANKYFVYTGNTTYGIQNLEYDSYSDSMIAAVYKGKKEQFPNYSMFFIDCSKNAKTEPLKCVGEIGETVSLTNFKRDEYNVGICGSDFEHGSTGIASIGDGYFYIAEHFKCDNGYGGVINLYKLDKEKLTFIKVSSI